MRFVCISPTKEKTLHIIENEMIAGEFNWTNDVSKVEELNSKLTAAGYSPLTQEEINEIDRHLQMIEEDKKSVE